MVVPVTSEAETYPFGPVEGLRLHPRHDSLREQPGLGRIRMPYGGVAWLVEFYAANHDQRAFADPDRLDLMRENDNSHLTFRPRRSSLPGCAAGTPGDAGGGHRADHTRSDRLVRGVRALLVAW
jgi:hypothetical protein